jgi:hypothetical protein
MTSGVVSGKEGILINLVMTDMGLLCSRGHAEGGLEGPCEAMPDIQVGNGAVFAYLYLKSRSWESILTIACLASDFMEALSLVWSH